MAKLWQKNYQLDQLVEQFTVGNDPFLDKQLIVYDCIGSIAHAHMLMSIGILTKQEFVELKKSLKDIIKQAEQKQFLIQQEDEDVHTAVENFLTKQLGDLGKKIHTARSRNDQVALDLRLYMRNELLGIVQELIMLCEKLVALAQSSKDIPMPGRTHFQRAMPSSWGLFFGAYAESLLDTITLLQNAYALVNQSPLGSAAGYGVVLPIDRQEVADLLGFAKVQNNVVYVSNSRGKIESIVVHALAQIMIDLSKLSTDLIIFSAPEFGYVEIPQELCSGSSLMPQKKNPCGLELVRAKSATVISNLMQTLMIIRALPSGYNRDFQETKQPLMNSVAITHDAVRICNLTVAQLKINADVCIEAFSKELFATDHVVRLVQEGMPFREAYKKVGLAPELVPMEDPVANIQQKTHQGASGNLNLEISNKKCAEYLAWVQHEQLLYQKVINQLLEG
jgi:argininosuccinate lyase